MISRQMGPGLGHQRDEPGDKIFGLEHDILTGSTPDGRAWDFNLLDLLNLEAGAMTCDNYTSSSDDGAGLFYCSAID